MGKGKRGMVFRFADLIGKKLSMVQSFLFKLVYTNRATSPSKPGSPNHHHFSHSTLF